MRKVKVSLDGKNIIGNWDVEGLDTVAAPHLTISNGPQTLQLTFESKREHERFYAGVKMCRASYPTGPYPAEIYVTKC